MAFIKQLPKRLRALIVRESQNEQNPETFSDELNYRGARLLFFASLITTFCWLPYIYLDIRLHPDKPLIPFIRIGLTLVSLIIFILHMSKLFPKRNTLFLVVLGAYLAISCALITALTKADPVYMGGYIFILTLLAVVPVERRWSLFVLAASLSVFFIVGFYNGISFKTPTARYSFHDLASASFVAVAFIFLLHDTRYTSWLKSKKIEQQSEELKSDKAKIDKLLLNILPPAIAQELKDQGHVKPVFYESATIVFTDFVGFTKITEKLTPDQLVEELDQVFSHFDHVMDKYGLEKLKTIGDSYMYAGGVPVSSKTHEIDAILGALEIQSFVEQINRGKSMNNRPVFEIRIGINTGPLMAGVVGEKKFVYDVWGDSVNLASRMESSGEKGRINISESTHERIKDYFETESRGRIMAKNKGTVEMFFVKRIKAEFSDDPEGLQPNRQFWEKNGRNPKLG